MMNKVISVQAGYSSVKMLKRIRILVFCEQLGLIVPDTGNAVVEGTPQDVAERNGVHERRKRENLADIDEVFCWKYLLEFHFSISIFFTNCLRLYCNRAKYIPLA